jgi:hypothetical protein
MRCSSIRRLRRSPSSYRRKCFTHIYTLCMDARRGLRKDANTIAQARWTRTVFRQTWRVVAQTVQDETLEAQRVSFGDEVTTVLPPILRSLRWWLVRLSPKLCPRNSSKLLQAVSLAVESSRPRVSQFVCPGSSERWGLVRLSRIFGRLPHSPGDHERAGSPEFRPGVFRRAIRVQRELSSAVMRKIRWSPLGACQGRRPWFGLGFRNALFPSWRLSPLFHQDGQMAQLSPLFYQDGQILLFSRPHKSFRGPTYRPPVSQVIRLPAGPVPCAEDALLCWITDGDGCGVLLHF